MNQDFLRRQQHMIRTRSFINLMRIKFRAEDPEAFPDDAQEI